ncbi:hypothetical protein GUITHDRAFT_156209 [Guillardia theta CCMP2712]|uniref:Uncharacterized protein n=1 Tax=Guillardia theta (strain CCMP2712) TaxID=905079 RepID=L1I9H0_GUITC|nr:hypothetical protein GUITHDRAFT_156209 [Guillardia theta CCMP2712]EKX32891.1 hypothetical protein GUITHDRAFT_156209 [Guillardia theta CCMP2712]|eukprot:XP_005819871.1 hypothetical protein GUITHDRAFT_156209 [Guillardia theta CCMP2712]
MAATWIVGTDGWFLELDQAACDTGMFLEGSPESKCGPCNKSASHRLSEAEARSFLQLKGRAVVALAVENLGEKERVKGRHFRGLRGSKLGTCDVDHFPHDKNSDGSTSAASGSA